MMTMTIMMMWLYMKILNSDDEDQRENAVEDNKQILYNRGNFVEVDDCDYDYDYDGARDADDDMFIVQYPSQFMASYIVYHFGSPGPVSWSLILVL